MLLLLILISILVILPSSVTEIKNVSFNKHIIFKIRLLTRVYFYHWYTSVVLKEIVARHRTLNKANCICRHE